MGAARRSVSGDGASRLPTIGRFHAAPFHDTLNRERLARTRRATGRDAGHGAGIASDAGAPASAAMRDGPERIAAWPVSIGACLCPMTISNRGTIAEKGRIARNEGGGAMEGRGARSSCVRPA